MTMLLVSLSFNIVTMSSIFKMFLRPLNFVIIIIKITNMKLLRSIIILIILIIIIII